MAVKLLLKEGHPFLRRGRELAQKLLSDGLEKTLWDSYIKAPRLFVYCGASAVIPCS